MSGGGAALALKAIGAVFGVPDSKFGRRPPKQQPGKSNQDVETPPDFIRAVEERFGKIDVDLAAHAHNAKALRYIDEAGDALSTSWTRAYPGKTMWLNPPFGKIGPWVAKCAEEQDAMEPGVLSRILVLLPAAVDANWFADHVHGRAVVLALRPRLTFVGHADPYPKGLMLCVYEQDTTKAGFDVWQWREKERR